MSLRSPSTKLAASLASLRGSFTWTGVAAIFGLFAVSATGCGGCDGSAAQPCPGDPSRICICDGLGCRSATQDTTSTGLGGAGGSTTTGSTSTTSTAPCDPTQATCPCDEGKCPSGKACVNGLCIVGCNFTYECGAGKVCADGACVPGCDATHGCDPGYACNKGACEPDPSNPQCDASHACPSGEICVNGLCTTGCNASSDCADGEICDGGSHSCVPDPSPKPVCDTSMPCPAGEVCLADGFCHYPCTTAAQCKLIDNRFVACDSGICKTDQEVNPQCTLQMPCPAGKTCVSNTCL